MTGAVSRKLDKVTGKISAHVQAARAGIVGKLTLVLKYLQNSTSKVNTS